MVGQDKLDTGRHMSSPALIPIRERTLIQNVYYQEVFVGAQHFIMLHASVEY